LLVSRVSLVALTALMAGACSAPALPPGYQEAERLERAGRYEAARRRYAAAARTCDKRPTACATTAMRVAQMHEKLGQRRQAIAAYRSVARGVGKGLREGARALQRAGRLLAALGQWDQALRTWWEVVDHYPETLAADDSLRRIVQRYQQRQRQRALLPLLQARYHRLQHQGIGDNLAFAAARILEESKDLGEQELAVRLYRRITRQYPEGGLRDNAWMRAAALRRRQGRFTDAILLYKELLRTREDAVTGASYHSEFLDDALLAIGKIWMLDLQKPARAIAAFRRLIEGKPDSVLRDDAQLWIVLAELERGKPAAAERAYARLLERFPESRFRRERAPLSRWRRLRAAARRGEQAAACRQWRRLKHDHAFSWLVRKGPRPEPWPRCEVGASRPGAGVAKRKTGVVKPGAGAINPDAGVAKPGAGVGKPGAGVGKPGARSATPEAAR